MNYLLGFDGSINSCAAAEFVGRIMSAERDEVVVYYSPPQAGVLTRTFAEPAFRERVERYITDAVLDEARKRLPEVTQEKVRFEVRSQNPADGMLAVADHYQADLIAVGARGSEAKAELAVGSVARAVVHHSFAPVLVVRPSLDDGAARPLRVLFASDRSDSSKCASKVLSQISWPNETVGRVMTVVESLVTGHLPSWLEEQLLEQEFEAAGLGQFKPSEEEQESAQEDLRRWCGELPSSFQTLDPIIAVGHPGQEIVRTIIDEDIDVVVVGARGLGPVKRFLLGSTSEHVLTHAPCSVLLVRQHDAT
jgi:nucleotide-binding universal stress UspA family protein